MDIGSAHAAVSPSERAAIIAGACSADMAVNFPPWIVAKRASAGLGLPSAMAAASPGGHQQDDPNRSDVRISSSVVDATPRLLAQLVNQARRALAVGLKPEFILEGSGGTYFLHDARKAKIAVFKPADEEPYAENNPRGYVRGRQHAALSGTTQPLGVRHWAAEGRPSPRL